MPKLAANLSWLWSDVPLVERFDRAASSGFSAVEMTFPYELGPTELAHALRRSGLRQALFNAPPGAWAAGERGIAAIADRREEFLESLATTAEYASALDCPLVHVLAGTRQAGAEPATLVEHLRLAVSVLRGCGAQPLVEPLNPRDHPGYLVDSGRAAVELVEQVPGLGLQADLYHLQLTDGDAAGFLRRHIAHVRHVQVASVPDRHEPDHGDLEVEGVLEWLDDVGYSGCVGLEYEPLGTTEAGLAWAARFL